MNLIRAKAVSKKYYNNPKAIDNLSYTFKKGNKIAIVGETGSGKSTFLKLMAGLEQADEGEISYKGNRVLGPNEKLVPGHEFIAYLSQHFELPKFINVETYLFDPYEITSVEAQTIYEACHIQKLLKADTRQLSGGEKQRVALAKLLMKKPDILLLDEPFSNLDYNHKNTIKNVLEKLEKKIKTTLIMVSHDPIDVLSWADEIVVMKSGKIIQVDKPVNIYERPISEYVAGIFGPYNLISKNNKLLANNGEFTELGNKVMIRPEVFNIICYNGDSVKGKLLKKHYYGSYEQLEINISEEIIMVKSNIGLYNKGDEVSILV